MSRIILLLFGSLIFLAATVSAQSTPARKIAMINSGAFVDPKNGLTRLVKALDAVDIEFRVCYDTSKHRRLLTLNDEIAALRNQPSSGVPADVKIVIAKFDEAERLEGEIKAQQEEMKVRFEKRWEEVVGLVMKDVLLALAHYAKQNQYGVVIDSTKSDCLLAVSAEDKVDITNDFMAFYNTKWTPSASN